MSPEHVEASSTNKRAQSYLRWYPSKWRERYGEEFVAHLESELAERPFSLARTSDIVAHGLLTRLSFQDGLRLILRAAIAAIVITGATLAAIALTNRVAPVTITSGYDGAVSGVGLFAPPSEVNDVSVNFSTHSRAAIRITSVTLEALPGFHAPLLVGVDFERHSSDLANARGWPIQFPKGSSAVAGIHLNVVKAIGTSVKLARTNALWLGLRAPKLGRAYAVDKVRVTYEMHGASYTMVINQSSNPDVICSSRSRDSAIPTWCSNEMMLATEVAAFAKHPYEAKEQAQLVSSLALNDVQQVGFGVPKLEAVRQLAARLNPLNDPHAILSVTGVVDHGVLGWRFVIQSQPRGATKVLCTSRGLVSRGAEVGVSSVTTVGRFACPSTNTANL